MMRRVIGVDAGSTLTKLVYEEDGRMHYKKFPTYDHLFIRNFLKLGAADSVVVTGGRADLWREAESVPLHEFDAVTQGTRELMKLQGKSLDEFILVNIGTGTSFFQVKKGEYERMLGSGIGGGMFMGLGTRLTGVTDFQELARLAGGGTRQNADLLVGDIYREEEVGIAPHLTAANFGKSPSSTESPGDRLRSLTNMMAETLILLSMSIATHLPKPVLVFVGNGVEGNAALQADLGSFKAWLGYEPVFPDNGGYAGAIGAYIKGLNSQNGQ
jgi:type II pantothenate kinase